MNSTTTAEISTRKAGQTIYTVLIAIGMSHLLNDLMQSIIPAVYPLLKDSMQLSFAQLGLITFVFQFTASILQPLVGLYTDKHPKPFSLAVGMGFTLMGLVLLSSSDTFSEVLISVALTGTGSAIFHPEASRIAYLASGGRRGLAQSVFQVGGNTGSSIGPLLAAAFIVPFGHGMLVWFSVAAMAGMLILIRTGMWYGKHLQARKNNKSVASGKAISHPKKTVVISLLVLLSLIFSKYFYMASMTSYFTFFMMEKFGMGVQQAQVYLFLFLGAIAAGTFLGGPIGDRYGRKTVIWFSVLGAAPFSLLLPHAANLYLTGLLVVCTGVILSSAFSAILVYAQELIPGRTGLISGMFFGLAFGFGGIGSALLGMLADHTSIITVFHICAWLPLAGILTIFLPELHQKDR